ncbi:hypothetical protein ACNPNP_01385 [Microbacterium sp. AGC85]
MTHSAMAGLIPWARTLADTTAIRCGVAGCDGEAVETAKSEAIEVDLMRPR